MPQTDPVRLADLTTMRVGGPAQRYLEASTTDELVDAVREVDDADDPPRRGAVEGGIRLLVRPGIPSVDDLVGRRIDRPVAAARRCIDRRAHV